MNKHAEAVDDLAIFLTSVSAFFTLLIFGLIVYFGIKYRRRTHDQRGQNVDNHWLEALWAAVPLAIMMVIFAWGCKIYFSMYESQPYDYSVGVLAKQWMWKFRHPDGRKEVNELHVPAGKTVRLHMISEDVIHSFFLPDFRVKMDVLPGKYITMFLRTDRAGSHRLYCAEYCGTMHARMTGHIKFLAADDFAAWAARPDYRPESFPQGQALFYRLQCSGCHQTAGQAAPDLRGLFQSTVPLADSQTVVADEEYIRTSILDPARHVREGFTTSMPTYAGQLDEEQLSALIEFVKSLKESP